MRLCRLSPLNFALFTDIDVKNGRETKMNQEDVLSHVAQESRGVLDYGPAEVRLELI